MNRIFATAIVGATMLTGSAFAQDAQPTGRANRDPMVKADADRDGVITKAEMLVWSDARFAKADANNDGKLTADERKSPRATPTAAAPGGKARAGVDADGDGAVTIEEQRAQSTKRFARIDRNADGKIDQAELEAGPARGGGRRRAAPATTPAPSAN